MLKECKIIRKKMCKINRQSTDSMIANTCMINMYKYEQLFGGGACTNKCIK